MVMGVREELRRVRKEEAGARHAREAEVGEVDVYYTRLALLAGEAVTVSVGMRHVILLYNRLI
jgi:hypothetical protein